MPDVASILARLVEIGPDAMFRYRVKPELACEYVSPSVTAMTGYTPEELAADPALGKSLLFPHSYAGLEVLLHPAAEPKPTSPTTYVGHCRRRDGSDLWVEMHVRPTYDENGDLVAIEGLARDVTVRQRLEEQIRASEQQFRRLFEGFPHGLAFSGDDWRFTRVNPAMARILGYARDELIGRTGIELTHPDDVAGNIEQIQRLGPGGAPSIHLDKRYLRKDGAIVRAHTTILPVFGDGGDFLYALVVVEDVTEQKAVEAELARARERELARRVEEARLEGVFLTVRESAHKLGNALSHASGYGELALLHPDLSPDVRDLLHDSREGLEEAIRYLATLQRVARVEVKETPVGPALDVERSSRPSD